MSDIFDLLRRMPKAELHMHVEGALEPEMMLAMARRNGIELPWATVEAAREAYRFRNLADFLKVFYQGLSVIVTEGDFFDVTYAYLERAHRDNVVHAELFASPQAHLRRGVAIGAMMGGIARAFDKAERELGMSVGLIVTIQRHLPEEEGFPIVEMIEPWRRMVLGFGLGGAELGNPPAKFARLFARCRALGYKLVAHAGEEGPASYVEEALDVLGVDRIDHGVRAAEDPDLVRRLATQRVPLTVCPVCNVRLGVFARLADHNLRDLLRQGVKVTLNSDDPAYISTYINDTFAQCVRELGLDRDDVLALAQNSFEAAFMSEERKAACLAQLDRFRA